MEVLGLHPENLSLAWLPTLIALDNQFSWWMVWFLRMGHFLLHHDHWLLSVCWGSDEEDQRERAASSCLLLPWVLLLYSPTESKREETTEERARERKRERARQRQDDSRGTD